MKKVLYICPNGYRGGAENFVLTACIGHLQSNLFYPIILFFNNGPAVDEARRLGIESHIIAEPFKLTKIFRYIKANLWIKRFILTNHIKIIHLTMPYSVLSCAWSLLTLNSLKSVWFQHGPVGGILDKVASFLPIDLIFYNSLDTKIRHLSSTRRIHFSEDCIIHLGVKASHEIMSQDSLKFRVLSMGRICSWKGQHLLLLALNEIREHYPRVYERLEVKVVGSANSDKDKYYEQSLKQMVHESKHTNVHFLGHQNDPSSFYSCSDVLAHTSTIPEPFGLVVAEAMIHNLLVIGSVNGGVADLLTHNKTGLAYDPCANDSHKQLAKLLVFAVNNDCTILKRNAYELVKNHYSVSNMMAQIESSYQRLFQK